MTDEFDDSEQEAREVRALLAELGIHGRDLEPSADESEQAERDLALILAGPEPDSRQPSVARRVARPLSLLAVAAVLAIGLVVARPFTGTDTALAQTPAILQIEDGGVSVIAAASEPGSDELLRLAELARRAEPPADGPVQRTIRDSWLLKTDNETGKAPARSVLVPVHWQQFFQPDGTVRTIERRGHPLDSDGRLTDQTGRWSNEQPASDETFPGPETGPEYPSTLSTDPAKLARQLVPDTEDCRPATYCLVAATNFLRYNHVLEPRLNAALLKMLAQLPDIRFAGESTDRLGRPADAFVVPGARASRVIILLFDPATGAFLGSEECLVKDSAELGLEAPAVLEFTALEDARRIPQSDVPDPALTTRY